MISLILKRVFIIMLISLILSSLTFYMLNRKTSRSSEVMLEVKSGMSLSSVSKLLVNKNLIRNRNFFMVLDFVIPGKTVRSGNYSIGKNFSTLNILRTLHGGRSISRKVTIPEGSNIYEIAVILDNNKITKSRNFIRACSDISLLHELKVKESSFEGYLFPDTYFFSMNNNPRNIIRIMHKRFRTVLGKIKSRFKGQNNLSHGDIIKLASLIEEEARISKERKYISSVFHNRLQKNMKLDCDPTVRYAVKKFRGKIYYRDLDSESPYNTYKHRGLPPTPISSPGKESIIAALQPQETNFLFFVARNDGSHYFSKRLSEHNRAVQKFQRGKKNGFIDRQNLN